MNGISTELWPEQKRAIHRLTQILEAESVDGGYSCLKAIAGTLLLANKRTEKEKETVYIPLVLLLSAVSCCEIHNFKISIFSSYSSSHSFPQKHMGPTSARFYHSRMRMRDAWGALKYSRRYASKSFCNFNS